MKCVVLSFCLALALPSLSQAKSISFPELKFQIFAGDLDISRQTQLKASSSFYGGITANEARNDAQNLFTPTLEAPVDGLTVKPLNLSYPNSDATRPWFFSGLELIFQLPPLSPHLLGGEFRLTLEPRDLKYLKKRFGETKENGKVVLRVALHLAEPNFLDIVAIKDMVTCPNGESLRTFLDSAGHLWVVNQIGIAPDQVVERIRNSIATIGVARMFTMGDVTWKESPWEIYTDGRRAEAVTPAKVDYYTTCGNGGSAIPGFKALSTQRPGALLNVN